MSRNREEGTADLGLLFRVAMLGHQRTVWTALPAVITKYDAARQTCEVQPTIKGLATDKDGVKTWIKMPVLVDCPAVFSGGGGFTLTFPVKPDDECVVVFSSRNIDSWWQSGAGSDRSGQVQPELRMHDLSDGFVIIGPRSLPRVLAGVSTTAVQLRSDDGANRISIDAAGNIDVTAAGNVSASAAGDINVVAGGQAVVTAPEVVINGNLTVNGTVLSTGVITAPDIAFQHSGVTTHLATHQHSGVRGGPDLSDPPVAGS